MNPWPLEHEADRFYGNPRGHAGSYDPNWRAIASCISMSVAIAHGPASASPVHHHSSQMRRQPRTGAGSDMGGDLLSQDAADARGYSLFSGSFNFRPIRGRSALSMHAYAAAIDWDAPTIHGHRPVASSLHR